MKAKANNKKRTKNELLNEDKYQLKTTFIILKQGNKEY